MSNFTLDEDEYELFKRRNCLTGDPDSIFVSYLPTQILILASELRCPNYRKCVHTKSERPVSCEDNHTWITQPGKSPVSKSAVHVITSQTLDGKECLI